MTWTEYRQLLLRWGWIVICCALLGAVAAWSFTQTLTPRYRARTYISMIPAEMDWRMRDLTKELAHNVTALFPAPALIEALQAQTDVATAMTADELARSLRASFDNGTLIIAIEAFHADPHAAGELAQVATRIFHAERSTYFTDRNFRDFIEFDIQATAPELTQIAPNTLSNTLAGLVLGLFAGTGLVLLLLWRDEEWLTRPEIVERTLNLPTLGIVTRD